MKFEEEEMLQIGGQIREFDWLKIEKDQSVIGSFFNIMFSQAFGEERIAVRGEGRPLHGCAILHLMSSNIPSHNVSHHSFLHTYMMVLYRYCFIVVNYRLVLRL